MGRSLGHKIAQSFEGFVQLAGLTLLAGEQKSSIPGRWHSPVLLDE
jgi:hypothetical protein